MNYTVRTICTGYFQYSVVLPVLCVHIFAFSAHTDTRLYVSGGFRLKYVAPNTSEALDKTD